MKSRLWTIRTLLAVLLCAAMMAGISGATANGLNNQEQVPNIITEGNIQRFAQRTIEWNCIEGADGYTLHWVMPGGEEKEFTSEADAWIALPVHATCDVGICTAWVVAHTGDGDVAGAEKEFRIVSGQNGNVEVTIMVNGEEVPDGGTAVVESGEYAEITFSFSNPAGGAAKPDLVYAYDDDSTNSWPPSQPIDDIYYWEKWYESPGEKIVAVQALFRDGPYSTIKTTVEAGIRLKVESGGNVWSEPEYTWAEDRKSVTASRYSIQDPSIRETETVAAAKIVLTSPGKETAGRWQEISGWFTNNAFSVQYGEEGTIPALDEMKVLYLPENIRTIDQEALAGTSCEAIYIPDGCSEIVEKAFENNTGLIYLRLPASVNEIPESAIERCPNVLIDWEK